MNGTNKRANTFSAANLCVKLAGTLGFAGVSSLLAFPAFSASPFFSKVNPNPTIFNEAPYNQVAQSTGSGAPRSDTVPNLDRGGTPGGTATPSGTPTNPSSAPTAEPSNIGPTQNRSTTPGSSTDSTGSPSAAPSGTPTNPSAAPRGAGGSGADVVVPSSGDSSGGMNMPTPAQGGSISPAGGNPTDSTTTPSTLSNPDRGGTTPSNNNGTTTPSYTPDNTTTPSSTPSNTTTPSSTPGGSTNTPSSTPSGGNGGVRALW